LLLPAWFC